MTPGMFLGAAILAAILLYVVIIGPLHVAWIFYKSRRAATGFSLFCKAARARKSVKGAPATVTIGDHEVQLVCLSEANRKAFTEAPIAMPPAWWKFGQNHGGSQPLFWPQDNRGQFLDNFPYEPIDINHGPVLVLISPCHHHFPFAIRRRRVFQRLRPQDLPREDTEFSRKVSVLADDRIGIRDYLTDERQAAILELFELGISNIMYVKESGRFVLASRDSFLISRRRTSLAPRLLALVRKLLPEGELAPATT